MSVSCFSSLTARSNNAKVSKMLSMTRQLLMYWHAHQEIFSATLIKTVSVICNYSSKMFVNQDISKVFNREPDTIPWFSQVCPGARS